MALLSAATAVATAQGTYPNRPIKIVVPLPPGATADNLRASSARSSPSSGASR